jgi:hypothetical protein
MMKQMASVKGAVRFFGVIVLLFLSHAATSQIANRTENVDSEVWTSVGVNIECAKRWALKTDHQFRTKSLVAEFDRVLSEVGVEYSPNGHFNVGIAGRYIGLNDNTGDVQGFEHHLRLQAEAELVFKHERLEVKQRIRYQNRNQIGISIAKGDDLAQVRNIPRKTLVPIR